MAWKESTLDAVLVPVGFAIMIAYHVRLVYRIRTRPTDTVIGINHINRKAWVENIMTDAKGNGVLAVQTVRNSIMASTLLASTAITLSSLIGALVSGTSAKSSTLILGADDRTIRTVKYLAILVCFLVAFVSHVQAIRYASHVSFLITIPLGDTAPGLTPEYVNRLIHRSTNFFSLGLRAYYFSFPLLLWLFGPIPHFICCIVMVVLLNIVDTAKAFKLTLSTSRPSHLQHPCTEDEKREPTQKSEKSVRPAV